MTICANPRCGIEFPDTIHCGRQKKYCIRSCGRKHWEAREHSDSRKRYLTSEKGKASKNRRRSNYEQSELGVLRREKLKSARINARLSAESIICKTCRDIIDPMTNRKTYCCDWCSWLGNHDLPKKPTAKVCPACKATHYRLRDFCSSECRSTNYKQQPDYRQKRRVKRKAYLQTPNGKRQRRLAKARRRTRKLEVWDEDVDVMLLAEWQKWKCYLCNKSICFKVKSPDPLSLSLDHLVPLSLGGRHSYANCAAAHFGCNSKKSARSVNEQLKLL